MEFDIMPVLFGIFLVGIVAAVALVVRHIKHNPVPVESATATVILKSSPSVDPGQCYAVFRLDSGPDSVSQMKLMISATQYNSLREGDRGELKFRGQTYLGFSANEDV